MRKKEVMKYVVGDRASQHGLQRDRLLSHYKMHPDTEKVNPR